MTTTVYCLKSHTLIDKKSLGKTRQDKTNRTRQNKTRLNKTEKKKNSQVEKLILQYIWVEVLGRPIAPRLHINFILGP
jgi:hypothetical protein